MVANAPRYLEKFEDLTGSVTYTFPEDAYRYSPEQAFRLPMQAFAGADYAHDFLGLARAPKEPGAEEVSFLLWASTYTALETAWDDLCKKLINTGLGKLWTVDAASNRRWCYARLEGLPSRVVEATTYFQLGVTCRFRRLSDWFASAAVTATTVINSASVDVVINNTGNANSRNLVLRLRSNSSAGFTNPTVTNVTTGDSVSLARTATSTNDEIKVDCFAHRVLFSSNDGASYADDWSKVTLGSTQTALLELVPGNNTLRFASGGTPSYNVDHTFYPAFHG